MKVSKNSNKTKKIKFTLPNRRIILTSILIILICTLFFQKNQYSEYSYELNSITKETIIAPFTFSILKEKQELTKDRNEAEAKIPYVFYYDKNISEINLVKFNNFTKAYNTVQNARKKYIESQKILRKNKYSKDYNLFYTKYETDSLTFFNYFDAIKKEYQIEDFSTISKSLFIGYLEKNDKFSKSFFSTLQQELKDLYATLVMDILKEQIRSEKISIQQDGEELLEKKSKILTLEEAWLKSKISLNKKYNNIQPELFDLGNSIIIHFLKPNLIYQKELTESRQREASNKVPISKGIVEENEKIVGANTKVTPEIYNKLESLAAERAKQSNLKGGIRKKIPIIGDPMVFIGQLALVAIILSFFTTFLLAYKPQILRELKMIILIGIIFISQVILSSFFVLNFNISEYSIPITIAAMMLTILFDTRIAFIGTSSLSILLSAQIGGDIYFLITSIFVSSLAIYSVSKLRKRSQMFASILYILIGYLLTITVTELLQFSTFDKILNHYFFAAINGIVSPVLTYGLIGLVEGPFDITTDLTLLELADFNHPLLKRLSKNATGTFSHCITVGNLAEAAADAIGANALLARVGSYYHDVGKISQPEYFVENQSYISNKHDNIPPNMSALVIINHVKEGQKLAKQYKLPEVLSDFISQHHGTTRVEYFYNRAINQAKDPDTVNVSDFEYGGPKPNTKETGIVMLVESIEAACRSVENPTISTIIKIIDSIIAQRLSSGQLDNCPLTFDDLKKIKGNIKTNTGILPVLKSVYHLRVEYPDQEKNKKSG